jgi:hypothetical protein
MFTCHPIASVRRRRLENADEGAEPGRKLPKIAMPSRFDGRERHSIRYLFAGCFISRKYASRLDFAQK